MGGAMKAHEHSLFLLDVTDDSDLIVVLNGNLIVFSDNDQYRYVEAAEVAARLAVALGTEVMEVCAKRADICPECPSEWTHDDALLYLSGFNTKKDD